MTSERERAAFEHIAVNVCNLSIRRDEEGHYVDINTLNAWTCCRAGADAARREERKRCAEIACIGTTENARMHTIAADIQDGFPDLTTEQVLSIYSAFRSALDKETA